MVNYDQFTDRKDLGSVHELTHGSNDLRFQSELIRETTVKIGHPTPPIPSDVWYLSDVVEHMPTGIHQY